MIASVRGRVVQIRGDAAVVEVGGVGLLVQCTPATLATLRPGAEAELSTSLVVREDALTLFGFADDDSREVFEVLQSATGIGPRLAQAVLAVHDPQAVRRAVSTEDLVALTAVPGIGKKGAQRLVLELKDKLAGGGAASAGPTAATGSAQVWQAQVGSGLAGLGFSAREIADVLAEVQPADPAAPDVAALLRTALQRLRRT